MIVVFNKTDVKKADFAVEWMQDFEAFQMAMMNNKDMNGEDGSSSGYMSSLVNSMSLMLEEFYSQLDVVPCSAFTGEGFDGFMDAVDKKLMNIMSFMKPKETES